jgi:hypothetical protein
VEGRFDLLVIKRYRMSIPMVLTVVIAGALLLLGGKNAKSTQLIVSPRLTSQFGIFRRAATQADSLPRDSGVVAQVTRSVSTGDPYLQQWATLSGTQACVVVDGTEPGAEGAPSACADLSQAQNDGQLLALGAASGPAGSGAGEGPPSILTGLAPDDVHTITVSYSDGKAVSVPVLENGFHVLTQGREPTNLTWTTVGGVHHAQNLKGA